MTFDLLLLFSIEKNRSFSSGWGRGRVGEGQTFHAEGITHAKSRKSMVNWGDKERFI